MRAASLLAAAEIAEGSCGGTGNRGRQEGAWVRTCRGANRSVRFPASAAAHGRGRRARRCSGSDVPRENPLVQEGADAVRRVRTCCSRISFVDSSWSHGVPGSDVPTGKSFVQNWERGAARVRALCWAAASSAGGEAEGSMKRDLSRTESLGRSHGRDAVSRAALTDPQGSWGRAGSGGRSGAATLKAERSEIGSGPGLQVLQRAVGEVWSALAVGSAWTPSSVLRWTIPWWLPLGAGCVDVGFMPLRGLPGLCGTTHAKLGPVHVRRLSWYLLKPSAAKEHTPCRRFEKLGPVHVRRLSWYLLKPSAAKEHTPCRRFERARPELVEGFRVLLKASGRQRRPPHTARRAWRSYVDKLATLPYPKHRDQMPVFSPRLDAGWIFERG